MRSIKSLFCALFMLVLSVPSMQVTATPKMSELPDLVIPAIQQRVNNKDFNQFEEKNIGRDIFGNLKGTRFRANGKTEGSEVRVIDENKFEVSLNLRWTYLRTEYRGVRPPIEESRTDTGKIVFIAILYPIDGIVISEVRREASTGDPNHDSARVAFNGLLEDVIKPNFRIK